MKIAPRNVERVLLLLVLLLALAVRLVGLDFGLPYTIHPDEPNVVDHAVVTIKTGDWNPRWYIYPSGYHYLQTGVLGLHLLWGVARGGYASPVDLPDSSHIITSAPGTYLWARGATALLGTLTVLLLYLLGRRLAAEPAREGAWRPTAVGLCAALLLALSPLHVEHSHYVTTDAPTTALSLLALLLILNVLERGGAGRALLAGLVVGAAGALKYNAVIALLPLLLALAIRHLRLGRPGEGLLRSWGRLLNRELGLALLGVALGFLLLCPFALADLPTFLDDLGYETHLYRFGGEQGIFRVYEVGGRQLAPWQAYAHALWVENPGAALAYLAGTLLALWRRRRQDVLLLVYTWGYYLFLSSYGTIFVRNILPALPGLILLGSDFLARSSAWLAQWLRRRRERRAGGVRPAPLHGALLLALLLAAMLVQPARRILAEDAYLATPPSQREARRWLDAHLAPADRVAVELHPLLFARAPYTATPVDYLSNYPLSAFIHNGYRYVVANSERYGPEYAERGTLPDHYAGLLERMMPVADFPGHTRNRPGPRLTIYAVPAGEPVPQHPLEASAGPLRLRGFDLGLRRGRGDLAYVAPTAELQAGQVLALTLYVQVASPPPADYEIRLCLLDGQGRAAAVYEGPPCAGACPPTGWTPGQTALLQQDLPLSAALPGGTYTLELAFLHPQSGEPLPFEGADGPLTLTEVEIQAR